MLLLGWGDRDVVVACEFFALAWGRGGDREALARIHSFLGMILSVQVRKCSEDMVCFIV